MLKVRHYWKSISFTCSIALNANKLLLHNQVRISFSNMKLQWQLYDWNPKIVLCAVVKQLHKKVGIDFYMFYNRRNIYWDTWYLDAGINGEK